MYNHFLSRYFMKVLHKIELVMIVCIMSVSYTTELYAADQQQYINETRIRQIYYVGTGIYQGNIGFQSNRLQLNSDISTLPIVHLGTQWWGDESKGLYAHGELGLGADLNLPAKYKSQTLSFNQNLINVGGQYRWYLSARPLAPDLTLKMGVYSIFQEVGSQNPTIFVNRSTYGPQISSAFTYPWKAHLWTRLLVGFAIPVVMREDPADSGEMEQGQQWFVQIEQHIKLSKTFGSYITFSYSQETINFNGFGTRADGVQNSQHDQSMLNLNFALTYR
jgi:hypothetical protein